MNYLEGLMPNPKIQDLISRVKAFREKQPKTRTPEEIPSEGGVDTPDTPSFLDKDEDLGFEGGPPSDDLKAAVEGEPEAGPGEEPGAGPDEALDDPLGDIGGGLGGLGGGEDEEEDEEEAEETPPLAPETEEEEEPEYPKERDWKPITPLDGDMKSLEFASEDEGFHLRMKKLDIVPNLWVATLYKKISDDEAKVIDYGQVFLPDDVEDPITYIKELANTVLDHNSMRYHQQLLKYNAAKKEKEEAAEEAPDLSNLLGGIGEEPETAPGAEEPVPGAEEPVPGIGEPAPGEEAVA